VNDEKLNRESRQKSTDDSDPRHRETLRVDEILRDLGFRAEAPESTARALVLNLIRNAYGEEAARSALRIWNQDVNRPVHKSEFSENSKTSMPSTHAQIQLSLFDLQTSSTNTELKKSS
jgi:hypothetical protein